MSMRTFHVQLPLQTATEIYRIHCAANNDTLMILAPFNSSYLCTFKKKSRNDSSDLGKKQT